MNVIVTGAAGALGRAIASRLSADGARLGLVDRPSAALAKLASEVGGTELGVEVFSRESLSEAVSRFERAVSGPVDAGALVAGAWHGGAPLHESDEGLDAMLEANTRTVHASLASLLPGMVARRHGSLVVIGSRNVERPWLGASAAAYTASKAAAVALARAAAEEVKEAQVRVNAVLVSTMDTPANRAAMPTADFSRWVTTASVAEVVAFLLGEGSRDVSGAEIPVYGRA
jgi:NAD(P)-dependent dehydrogenase (short-subunit alcohol dehydrogenase family)